MNEPNSVIPFTEDDLQRLKQAERYLADIIPVMDKCENCGMEMTASRELAAQLSEKLQNFRHQFFEAKSK